MLKKRENPTTCQLAEVKVRDGKQKDTKKPVSRMADQKVYHRTLTLFNGTTEGSIGRAAYTVEQAGPYGTSVYSNDSFDDVYRKLGGTWITEQQIVPGEVVYSAFFGCRREKELIREKGPDGEVWYKSPQYATQTLVKIAKSKVGQALCATCPYKGMSPAQADTYDAQANTAEATRLRSEAALAQARIEVAQHLKDLKISPELDAEVANPLEP